MQICVTRPKCVNYLLSHSLTHSLEQSPFWETNKSSVIQKIPRILRNPKVHYSFISADHLSLSWARSIQSMSPSHFLKIHLNIILPFTPVTFKWSLSLSFPHQNPVSISALPHTCYMPLPSHSSRFDHLNSIWWGVQVFELLIHRWLSVIISNKNVFDFFAQLNSSVCPAGKC